MRLIFISLHSNQTLTFHVPNSCTLPQLRQILSQILPFSPSPASIRLSRNLKYNLQSHGPHSLQSLGIASGDLIYFFVERATPITYSDYQNTLFQVRYGAPTPCFRGKCSTSLGPRKTLPGVEGYDSAMLDSKKRKIIDMRSQVGEETVRNMEVDDEVIENKRISNESLEVVDKSFSVPGFLRKVFADELGGDEGRRHKLVVIAVHAVMLESGFLGVDEKTEAAVNGFQLRNEWPLGLSNMSLFYTLPESVREAGGKALKNVVLKFQSMGNYLIVYGEFGRRGVHSVQLNEGELVPFLNAVRADCGAMENVSGQEGGTSPEKEVVKFWRSVKDNLALPLLIDFCKEADLVLPPCFMRLPNELMLKILKSLSGVDVAKVSCVSSELRNLASSDDLWKMKFEEFRGESRESYVNWKEAFSTAHYREKAMRRAFRVRATTFYWPMQPYWRRPRMRRYPNVFPFQRGPPNLREKPPYGDDDPMKYQIRHGLPLADDLQTKLHDHDQRIHPINKTGYFWRRKED